MEKLVSVSRTVSHSSTIICDILSRILNETVMKDEIICKICFNLLDDIDYHLKEAQVGFNSFLYFRQQRFFSLVCTGFYEIEYGVIARELRRKTLVLI